MSANPKKPAPHYETSDAQAWIVAIAGGVLVLMLALVALSSHLTLRFFGEKPNPNELSETTPLLPEPRLQVHPAEDLGTMRQEEDRALNQYGWVDAKEGIIHIPIDRAIALVAQRHLPSRDRQGEEP